VETKYGVGLRTGQRGIWVRCQAKYFSPVSIASEPALRPTQPPLQCITVLFLGDKFQVVNLATFFRLMLRLGMGLYFHSHIITALC
jgi:hypothetical protein